MAARGQTEVSAVKTGQGKLLHRLLHPVRVVEPRPNLPQATDIAESHGTTPSIWLVWFAGGRRLRVIVGEITWPGRPRRSRRSSTHRISNATASTELRHGSPGRPCAPLRLLGADCGRNCPSYAGRRDDRRAKPS